MILQFMPRVLGLLLAAGLPLAGHAAEAPRTARPALMSSLASTSVVLDVAPAGARLVAVGERGHILLSDDDGASWRQVPSPVAVSLTAVRFADARSGWAVGHGGVILGTDDGGETWTRRLDGLQAAALLLAEAEAGGSPDALATARRLVTEGADKPFLALAVLDARRVMAFGAYGLALRSDDGGRTWRGAARRVDNPDGWHINAAATAGAAVLLAGEQGFLRLSTDGGETFAPLVSPATGSLFGALALSERDFLIVGLRGKALRSTDGGASWSACAVPAGDVTLTAAVGLAGGRLAVATAGGDILTAPPTCETWSRLPRPPGSRPLGALAALAVSANGRGLITAGALGLAALPVASPSP